MLAKRQLVVLSAASLAVASSEGIFVSAALVPRRTRPLSLPAGGLQRHVWSGRARAVGLGYDAHNKVTDVLTQNSYLWLPRRISKP